MNDRKRLPDRHHGFRTSRNGFVILVRDGKYLPSIRIVLRWEFVCRLEIKHRYGAHLEWFFFSNFPEVKLKKNLIRKSRSNDSYRFSVLNISDVQKLHVYFFFQQNIGRIFWGGGGGGFNIAIIHHGFHIYNNNTGLANQNQHKIYIIIVFIVLIIVTNN